MPTEGDVARLSPSKDDAFAGDDKVCDTLSCVSTTAFLDQEENDASADDLSLVSAVPSEDTLSEVRACNSAPPLSRTRSMEQRKRSADKLERKVLQLRMSLATAVEIAHDKGMQDVPFAGRVERAVAHAGLAVHDAKDEHWSQIELLDDAHEAVHIAAKVLYEVWSKLDAA